MSRLRPIINRMDQTRKGRLSMWKDYFRKEQKEKVWRLHCDGLSISQISDRLKIAVPTVSRWISEREKEEG